MLQKLAEIAHDPWKLFWVGFGFAGQCVFGGRFIWQWFVSEKKGRSTVPLGFWILSLVGGVMLFVYACEQQDPVFMAGQGLGVFIYIRNLMLISRRQEVIRQRHPRMVPGKPQDPAVSGGDAAAGTWEHN